MNKFFIIFISIVIYQFFLINNKLLKINMSLDSNTVILNQYVNKEKLKDSDIIIDKIKKNINAYKNYDCGSCHLVKQKFLLPIRNLDFNTFKSIIRNGNQYMDTYNNEVINDTDLKELYNKLYNN